MVMGMDRASATKKLPFLKLKREAGIDLWVTHLPSLQVTFQSAQHAQLLRASRGRCVV